MSSEGDGIAGLLVVLLFLLFFAAIIVAFVLIVRYILRRNRERVAAMQAYAAERGLAYEGDVTLPRATPLLRRGGRGISTVSGRLADGLDGRLADYRYTTGTGDDKRTYHFATVLAPLPEAGSARLYCYPRVAAGLFDAIGDALTQYQTVELESEAFSARFQLVVRDEASMVAIRQLFSPSFIVFLSEHTPEGYWFELEEGHLVGAIKGQFWEQPERLDELCAVTAAVAQRFREDIAERAELRGATAPTAEPPPAAEPPPPPPAEPPPPPPA